MNMMILAHRGASAYAPENTLAAFYKAVELGANGLELDLRAARDGEIVVIHDATVDRTTNGTGPVADYTWDELQRLDAGSWFSDAYAGERMITFREFLHYFGRKPLFFAVELKERGLEREVIGLLRQYSLYDRCTVTSFHHEILETVKSLDPRVNIGLLTAAIDQVIIDRILAINGRQICPQAETLTREDVQSAKRHGFDFG